MFSLDSGGGEGGISRHWNGTIHGWTNEDTLDLRNIFVQNEARGSHSVDVATDRGRRNLLLPRLSSSSANEHDNDAIEDDSISRREGRYFLHRIYTPSSYRGGVSCSNEPQEEGPRYSTGTSNNNSMLFSNHKDHTDQKRKRLLILGDENSGTAEMHQWVTRGAHAGSSGGPRVWAGLYGGERAVLGGIGENEWRAREEAVRVAMTEWPLSPRELTAIERRKARPQERDGFESGVSSPTRPLELSSRGFYSPRALRGMDGQDGTARPQLSAPDGGGYHRTVIGGSVYGAAVAPRSGGRDGSDVAWGVLECGGGRSSGAETLTRKTEGNKKEEEEAAHKKDNADDPYEIEEAFLKSVAPRPPSLGTFEGEQHQLRVLEAIAELTCSPLNPCNNAWASSATNPSPSSGASSLAKAFVPPSLMSLLAVEAVEERVDRAKRSRIESDNDRKSWHPFDSSSPSYSAPARLSDAFYQIERLTNKGSPTDAGSHHNSMYGGGRGLAAACAAIAEEERLRKALLTGTASASKGPLSSLFQVSPAAMFLTSVGKASSTSVHGGSQGGRYLLPNGLTPSQRFALLRMPAIEDDLFVGERDGGTGSSRHGHGGGGHPLIGRASMQRGERQGRVLTNYGAAASHLGSGSGGLAGGARGSASVSAVGGRSVAAATDLAASTSASMLGSSLGRSYGSTIRSQKDRAVLGGVGVGGVYISSFSSPTSPSSPSPIEGKSPSDATGIRQSSDGINNGVLSGTPMQSLMALVTMGVDPERVVALLER